MTATIELSLRREYTLHSFRSREWFPPIIEVILACLCHQDSIYLRLSFKPCFIVEYASRSFKRFIRSEARWENEPRRNRAVPVSLSYLVGRKSPEPEDSSKVHSRDKKTERSTDIHVVKLYTQDGERIDYGNTGIDEVRRIEVQNVCINGITYCQVKYKFNHFFTNHEFPLSLGYVQYTPLHLIYLHRFYRFVRRWPSPW